MIFLIGVIFTFSFFRICKKKNTFTAYLVGGFIIPFFVSVIISTFMKSTKMEYTETNKAEIISLENILDTQGNFFLLSGSIQSEPCYIFYFKTPRGSKQLMKIPSEGVDIWEEDRKDAYIADIIQKEMHTFPNWMNWMLLSKFFFSNSFSYDSITGKAFHVPKGTIANGILLDVSKIKASQ